MWIGQLFARYSRSGIMFSKTTLVVFFLATGGARVALGCGLDWSEPRGRMEGCNNQGYVFVAEKLAEVTIPGETGAVPIWATFDSSRRMASPFAGMSWRIPFFEPALIQLTEDEFHLYEIGGWRRLFRRDAKNRDILNGAGDWKGQISKDKDKITVWATCGWRMDFVKGKITQIKTQRDKTLLYNYTKGRLASITCDGKTLVSIDPVEKPEGKLTILIEGRRYTLEKSKRPSIRREKDSYLVSGNTPCFHQWSGEKDSSRTFSYGVNDKSTPSMTITETGKPETIINWHPETQRITRYGEWQYEVKPSGSSLGNAQIGRTNPQGLTEYWFHDQAKGKEIVRGGNGVTQIMTWFTSGAAAGSVRSKEVQQEGVTNITKYAYDENGGMRRKQSDGQRLTYMKGGLIESIHDGGTPVFFTYKDGNVFISLEK